MELALFARGLCLLGAFRQSGEVLDKLKNPLNAQVDFFKAAWHIDQWQYAQAIAPLRACIRKTRDPYLRQVAELNLCSSLVAINDKDRAIPLIQRLFKKIKKQKNVLLLGNLLEIYAQLMVQNDDLDRAQSLLEQAQTILREADAKSFTYVNKWEKIIGIRKGTIPPQELMRLRDEAKLNQNWEVVRDCDFHLAILTNDSVLLQKVYWGSRFKAYNERIQNLAGDNFDFGKTFVWHENGNSKLPAEARKKIDLVERAPTYMMKRLFFILTMEYYAPLRLTEIIDFVYQKEFYNYLTSPKKIHRLIERARVWLKEEEIDFEILSVERNKIYLQRSQSLDLILNGKIMDKVPTMFPESFGSKNYFTTEEWANEFGISLRTASRQIQNYLERGIIIARSKGKYRKI
jgi:hypothetical protein